MRRASPQREEAVLKGRHAWRRGWKRIGLQGRLVGSPVPPRGGQAGGGGRPGKGVGRSPSLLSPHARGRGHANAKSLAVTDYKPSQTDAHPAENAAEGLFCSRKRARCDKLRIQDGIAGSGAGQRSLRERPPASRGRGSDQQCSQTHPAQRPGIKRVEAALPGGRERLHRAGAAAGRLPLRARRRTSVLTSLNATWRRRRVAAEPPWQGGSTSHW